jgi:hypothetical protein
MEGISEREYSAHSGLSREAIQTASSVARMPEAGPLFFTRMLCCWGPA